MHGSCQRGEEGERVLAGHLLVDTRVGADDIDPHRFQPERPGLRVSGIDQVRHQPDSIEP